MKKPDSFYAHKRPLMATNSRRGSIQIVFIIGKLHTGGHLQEPDLGEKYEDPKKQKEYIEEKLLAYKEALADLISFLFDFDGKEHKVVEQLLDKDEVVRNAYFFLLRLTPLSLVLTLVKTRTMMVVTRIARSMSCPMNPSKIVMPLHLRFPT